MRQAIRKLSIVGACSKGITAAETGGGREVDATHVLDYVIPYGINFDHYILLS